jgi:hypothetical protein
MTWFSQRHGSVPDPRQCQAPSYAAHLVLELLTAKRCKCADAAVQSNIFCVEYLAKPEVINYIDTEKREKIELSRHTSL